MDFVDVLYPTLLICGLVGIIILLGVGFSYVWLMILDRQIRACPECGRKASGIIVDSETIVESSYVDHRWGKSMRITVKQVTDHYECKHCAHTWIRSFRQTERDPVEGPIRR